MAGGAPWCWGAGSRGQLGNGGLTLQSSPVAVSTTSMSRPVTAITGGAEHTCAIDDDGDGWCWGTGDDGRLGTGNTTSRSAPWAVVDP